MCGVEPNRRLDHAAIKSGLWPPSKIGNNEMPTVRLQKFLADAGICSRRHAETMIADGRVKVNGAVVTEMGVKVDPAVDMVEADGLAVQQADGRDYIYIAVNKPKGYVSSCAQNNAKLVVDLVDIDKRVYPVGRLDKDSTGLILLTNDGRLHLEMSHPSFDHEKEYEVWLRNPVMPGAVRKLREGLMLDGVKTRPAKVTVLMSTHVRMVLQEGRNRQIRRMFKKVDNEVVALKRVRFGNIRLGDLKEGRWRYLTAKEVGGLLKGLGNAADAKNARAE